jgi:low affinity Fe/Cu permease
VKTEAVSIPAAKELMSVAALFPGEGRWRAHFLKEEPPMPLGKPSPVRPGKHWTTILGQTAAHPAAFAVVLIYPLAWIVFDRRSFDFNAVATLIVWVMALFIQRSSRRDTLAIHAKLDELLRANEKARSELAMLDEHEPETIKRHRDDEVRALRETE